VVTSIRRCGSPTCRGLPRSGAEKELGSVGEDIDVLLAASRSVETDGRGSRSELATGSSLKDSLRECCCNWKDASQALPTADQREAFNRRPPRTTKWSRLSRGEGKVVRVTAHSLSRMMGLAGESDGRGRWLQPFAGRLLSKETAGPPSEGMEEVWQRPRPQRPPSFAPWAGCPADTRGRHSPLSASASARFEFSTSAQSTTATTAFARSSPGRIAALIDGCDRVSRAWRDMAGKGQEGAVRQSSEPTDAIATSFPTHLLFHCFPPLHMESSKRLSITLLRNALDHGMELPRKARRTGKPATGQNAVEAQAQRWYGCQITVGLMMAGHRLREAAAQGVGATRQCRPSERRRGGARPRCSNSLFMPGFSTAEKVTEVSGRGVGLDVVTAWSTL